MSVRVALIGYGYAGRTFHAPLILATPGLELVIVVSRNAELVHTDVPDVSVIASVDEAIAAASVDLIVIATPNEAHVPLAGAAMSGGKHVVVDKPLAPTLAEARHLAVLAQRTNRLLATFQNRRWDGDFLAVKDPGLRAALGDITHFESHFDRFRPEVKARWRELPGIGSGVWFDLGPHLVDQALQLFGLPDHVMASFAAQRPGAQATDWAHVVLEYGERRAILHASMLAAAPLVRFIVHGTRGSWIKYGLDRQERDLVARMQTGSAGAVATERAVMYDGMTGVEREMPVPAGDYTRFYAAVRDAVTGRGANPVPPAQTIAVTAVIETAIHACAAQRALPVSLNDAERRAFQSDR